LSKKCQNSGNPNEALGNDEVFPLFERTPDHENVVGSECIITRILNMDVRYVCSVSRPSRFNPEEEEEVPCTGWISNFLKTRAGLEVSEKRKMSFPCRKLNGDSFVN
jgi:hypothetical protein